MRIQSKTSSVKIFGWTIFERTEERIDSYNNSDIKADMTRSRYEIRRILRNDHCVVMADLASYRSISPVFHESGGYETIGVLNKKIKNCITDAVAAVGGGEENIFLPRGHGALLRFNSCDQGLSFAARLQDDCRLYNRQTDNLNDRLIFRIGVGTGDLHFDPNATHGPALAGMAVFRAAQLEAAAVPGGVLIDAATWEGASLALRIAYSGPETFACKRGEMVMAYRALVDPDAAPALSVQSSQPRSIVDRSKADLILCIKDLSKRLRREEFDLLVIILIASGMPQDRAPSDRLNNEQRVNELLHYANNVSSGLEDLHSTLTRFVGQ